MRLGHTYRVRKAARLLLVTGLCCVWLAACERPDNLPQLEIVVLNTNLQPVEGTAVALFDSYEEWVALKNPVQVWRKTGTDGKVLFTDLQEMSYYMYARFGEQDNALDEITISEPLVINQRRTITIHIK